MISVFGIGNPLMDFVVYEDFEFIKSLSASPGTMKLISQEESMIILNKIKDYKNIPGGSCANTLRGIAWLGKIDPVKPPLFSGAVGQDDVGEKYITQMEDMGIRTCMGKGEGRTGVSIVIVTPDHERSMFTNLGACREFSEKDLDIEMLKQAQYLHVTGYMWDTENQKIAIKKAVTLAKAKNIRVSFDLADPFVVERFNCDFKDWIPGNVDILFGNRAEVSILLNNNDGDDRELIKSAGFLCPLVIMKVGDKGCYINDNGNIIYIKGIKVKVVDTVGPGDFFASGFLFGLLKKRSVTDSAVLANALASRIVTVAGCSLHELDSRDLISYLK